MIRLIATGLIMALMANVAMAEEVKVTVQGMVCAFCAQGIEHSLKEQKAVDKVQVDLDNGLVTVHTQGKGDLSDEAIKNIITEAGFTVEKMERI